jgi:WD40 repeat protein
LLYGESGAGKSSLVNAGLIPAAEAEGFDFRVDRIRVQPHLHHELVVERIAVTPDGASFLRSSFAIDADGSQIVLSIEAFRAQLDKALSMKVRPLLIFDQFEELITLFEEARGEGRTDAREAQLRIVSMLVELLLHQTMPVKLVFSFREDYLAQVKELLALSPELVNQSLRLTPPPTDALYEIVRDPFEKHPGHFGHELMPELAHRLSAELASRSPSGAINLSEMQIVCLRLWEASDPEALLEQGGVQAVLEDYLEESLNRFPQELHYPAVALLSQLVTATGVRNIVAREDLIQRVRSEEPDIPEERVEAALGALESETRLVRRERRGDLDLFEISSEFLVPWIGRQRADRLRAREQARLAQELEEKRRRQRARLIQRLGLVISGLFVAAAVLAGLTFWKWRVASSEGDESRSREIAQRAFVLLDAQRDPGFQLDPEESVHTAFRAYDSKHTSEAEEALRAALVESRRRALLRGHRDAVTSARFSEDGQLLVTAGADGTVRFWDVETGNPADTSLQTMAASASFSPDGTLVLTAGTDGIARVWNRETREPAVLRPRPGQGRILTANFSPNGSLVVTGSDNGSAHVWRWSTGAPIATLEGHLGPVWSARFSSDGNLVVTASEDGTARVWRWSEDTEPAILRRGRGRLFGAAFDPDGEHVVTASEDGVARVWDWKANEVVTSLRGHRGPVLSAAFSPDGNFVVTAASSDSQQLQVWEIFDNSRAVSGRRLATLHGVDGQCYDAVFSPDGTLIASACSAGSARLWDPATGRTEGDKEPTRGSVRAAISSDGTRLVTGDEKGTVQMWETSDLTRGVTFEVRAAVNGVAFSPDGERVVAVLSGHLGPVSGAAFSPDGKLVVTAGQDGTFRLWEAAGTQIGRALNLLGPVNTASFSPDGKLVVTAGEDGIARVWDVEARKQVHILSSAVTGPATSAAFSPDGALVAVAKGNGTATIWNIEDLEKPKVLTLLRGRGVLTGLSFSGDGKFVVTSDEDGTARVWGTQSGRALNVLRGHSGSVNTAVFSPRDATAVITAGDDGTVRRFTCDGCLPIADLEELGNWTDEELKDEAP